YRTRRLEALLERDTPSAVDEVIASFTQDVERLKELEAEVAELDPQAAGQSVFRDPERLGEAEEVATKVRDGAAPPPGPSGALPPRDRAAARRHPSHRGQGAHAGRAVQLVQPVAGQGAPARLHRAGSAARAPRSGGAHRVAAGRGPGRGDHGARPRGQAVRAG